VGKVEGVAVVTGTPMPSKFCVYAVDVDRDMAAKTTATDIQPSIKMEAITIKKRDFEIDAGIDFNMAVSSLMNVKLRGVPNKICRSRESPRKVEEPQ
jgi:hypothetical protein